jgi:hypothetical protein
MKKFLFVCSLAVIFACNNNPKKASSDVVNNPLSASDTSASLEENAPIMTFDENIHDFGMLVDGEVVTYKFKFKNTGKGDLIISGASASCGCTVPSYPKEPLSPGAESAIDVQFNSSGKVGTFEKNVTITSNTIPTQIYLVIRGEVKEKK